MYADDPGAALHIYLFMRGAEQNMDKYVLHIDTCEGDMCLRPISIFPLKVCHRGATICSLLLGHSSYYTLKVTHSLIIQDQQ